MILSGTADKADFCLTSIVLSVVSCLSGAETREVLEDDVLVIVVASVARLVAAAAIGLVMSPLLSLWLLVTSLYLLALSSCTSRSYWYHLEVKTC